MQPPQLNANANSSRRRRSNLIPLNWSQQARLLAQVVQAAYSVLNALAQVTLAASAQPNEAISQAPSSLKRVQRDKALYHLYRKEVQSREVHNARKVLPQWLLIFRTQTKKHKEYWVKTIVGKTRPLPFSNAVLSAQLWWTTKVKT